MRRPEEKDTGNGYPYDPRATGQSFRARTQSILTRMIFKILHTHTPAPGVASHKKPSLGLVIHVWLHRKKGFVPVSVCMS